MIAAGIALTLGIVIAPTIASAQDAAATAHPAHIHSGSCAELGDVVHPLTDVSADATSDTGTPVADDAFATPHSMEAMASPEMDTGMGTPVAGPFDVGVATSETIVQAALADLSAGGYAINVHESAENIGNYIACGDIAGTAADSGDLTIQLAALNDSGYTGTAVLHDNGDGTTTVSITLMQDES